MTNETNYLKTPIPFYGKKDDSLSPKGKGTTPERDRDATVHEVRYDPTDVDSQTYKVYLSPFDSGTPEQWLKFCTKLDLIMTGNGLTTGPARFNFTKSVLKGEALQNFTNKATDLGAQTVQNHRQCLQAVSDRIFPTDALQEQKRHLRHGTKLREGVTISEYFARWHEVNDYLAHFPPHGGNAQKYTDTEMVEIIYMNVPAHMRSDLRKNNEFQPQRYEYDAIAQLTRTTRTVLPVRAKTQEKQVGRQGKEVRLETS